MPLSPWCRTALMALALAIASASAGPAVASAPDKDTAVEVSAPIRSREALDAYLHTTAAAGIETPFDRLSPGARTRFISSLVFGERGLGGFDTEDLSTELSSDEIRQIFALFGEEPIAAMVTPASAPRSAGERSPAPQQLSDIERRFNAYYAAARARMDETDREAAARYRRMLAMQFPEARDMAAVKRLDDHDLRLVYRAARDAAFHDTSPTQMTLLAAMLQELEARGTPSQREVHGVYDGLLATRLFDQARQFAAAHPQAGLAELPELQDSLAPAAGAASVWTSVDQVMRRTALDLQPTQILVMAGCHFSEDAAREITTDPELGPLFRRNARWLALPPGRESFDAVRTWNRKFPDAPMLMLYDRAEWPMFEHWRMPTFYIFKDGQIIESVAGWRDEESKRALRAALQRAGLLPPGAAGKP